MSTIKFAPNPSGSAQFTIASPATSTNRIITLPDETTTLVGVETATAAATAVATNLAAAFAIALG